MECHDGISLRQNINSNSSMANEILSGCPRDSVFYFYIEDIFRAKQLLWCCFSLPPGDQTVHYDFFCGCLFLICPAMVAVVDYPAPNSVVSARKYVSRPVLCWIFPRNDL